MRIFFIVALSFFTSSFCPCSSGSVFLRRNEASRVLRVQKRAYQFLEEILPGNLERECYEETCSFEEAREIFKAQEKTTEFWFHYKDLNPCKVNPCQNGGICQQYRYDYVCLCPPRFTGKLCETERFECWYKNGGCWQYCQNEAQSQDVTCSCAEGYTLDENGKACAASALFPCGTVKSSLRSLQDDSTDSLQDDYTLSFLGDSIQSLQDDSAHLLQNNATLSLQDNATHTHQDNATHTRQDNSVLSLQDNSTCSLKVNTTCAVSPLDNFTNSPLDDSASFPEDNSTSFRLDNSTGSSFDSSTYRTLKSSINAPLQDLSSNNHKVQDEDGLKFMNENISDGNWDESTGFKEALENNDTRIVGGVQCHLGSCPWQHVAGYRRRRTQNRCCGPEREVLIYNSRGLDFCGGSLISSRWVLSASHCFEDINPHHVTIGDFDKFRWDQDEQKIAVLKFYMHPHYNSLHFDNDIALLYLRSDIQFNDFAIPICLPNPSLARMLLQEGETGMVSGWGSTRHMGPSSRFLLKVRLPVVSQKTCMKSTQQIITGGMFCAGYSIEARDSCKGDSGGPFAMSYRDTWYLMGVISWGEGCATEGKYGVYTRVSNYIQWIKETIEEISETETFVPTAKQGQ